MFRVSNVNCLSLMSTVGPQFKSNLFDSINMHLTCTHEFIETFSFIVSLLNLGCLPRSRCAQTCRSGIRQPLLFPASSPACVHTFSQFFFARKAFQQRGALCLRDNHSVLRFYVFAYLARTYPTVQIHM